MVDATLTLDQALRIKLSECQSSSPCFLNLPSFILHWTCESSDQPNPHGRVCCSLLVSSSSVIESSVMPSPRLCRYVRDTISRFEALLCLGRSSLNLCTLQNRHCHRMRIKRRSWYYCKQSFSSYLISPREGWLPNHWLRERKSGLRPLWLPITINQKGLKGSRRGNEYDDEL